MDEVLSDARGAIAAGQRRAATSLLKQVVRTMPTNGEAWFLLAEVVTDPVQKAECERRAVALGYVPSSPSTAPPAAPPFSSTTAGMPRDVEQPPPQTGTTTRLQPDAVPLPNQNAALSPINEDGAGGEDAPTSVIAQTAQEQPSVVLAAAPFGYRLMAWLVDIVIVVLLNTILGVVLTIVLLPVTLTAGERGELFIVIMQSVLGAVSAWLYFALLESSRLQATVGKRVAGLKVTDLHGQRISPLQASVRFWGQCLSLAFFSLGYWLVLFTPLRQTLHDLLAGCRVVRRS